MLPIFQRLVAPCLLLLAAAAADAQIYKLHNADVTGSGIGQFTTVLTSDRANVQQTTDSFGGLISLRDHPVAWAGIELNYSYNRYSQNYSAYGVKLASIQNNVHEATGAYLFHPHFRNLQPFVAIGGGALAFMSVRPGPTQWRGTGLFEVGFDMPVNPNFGFRAQGRTLVYRAPNFNNSAISSESWVATTEPSLGAYIRF